MPNPEPAHAEQLTIQIDTLCWERIQLVLLGRLLAPDALDPGRFGIRAITKAGAFMPATHAELDGDRLYLRFNVMQGPGQMPVEPGHWQLTFDGHPVRAEAAGEAATARFPLTRGTYVASAGVNEDGHLAVEVSLQDWNASEAAELRQRRTKGSPARHLLSATRHRIFVALIDLVAAMLPHSGRRVLFTSDSRHELSGNLKAVHDRMVERGLQRRYRLQQLLRPSVAQPRRWRDRLRMPLLFGLADVILLDDYQPAVYRLRPSKRQRIVQLWHASGAFKTVGYSRIGKPGGPSPYARVHKNYTNAIVSSAHDVPFYAEAFGIPEARVVPTGIPRMDRFFDDASLRQAEAAARAAFPALAGRRTILFAPTFRGHGPRDATYDFSRVDFGALHRLALDTDSAVIVKMHPFVPEAAPIPPRLTDRIIDASTNPLDINELLLLVDLLITDYSSIVFEFSTLGRPMLFYAYDLDDYVADRDFYVPFHEFVPGRIVTTFDELLQAIRDEDYQVDKVVAFAKKHFDHLDGSSTDRVIDELILGR